MIDRRIDEVAGDLDDLSIEVEELKEQPAGPDRESLDKLTTALEAARDAVDEITDAEGDDT